MLADHYKLERIFELLVVVTTDILNHHLAERLQDAAGMRNVIVHLYERVNYAILRDSIKPAPRDFSRAVALFKSQIEDKG